MYLRSQCRTQKPTNNKNQYHSTQNSHFKKMFLYDKGGRFASESSEMCLFYYLSLPQIYFLIFTFFWRTWSRFWNLDIVSSVFSVLFRKLFLIKKIKIKGGIFENKRKSYVHIALTWLVKINAASVTNKCWN